MWYCWFLCIRLTLAVIISSAIDRRARSTLYCRHAMTNLDTPLMRCTILSRNLGRPLLEIWIHHCQKSGYTIARNLDTPSRDTPHLSRFFPNAKSNLLPNVKLFARRGSCIYLQWNAEKPLRIQWPKTYHSPPPLHCTHIRVHVCR